MKFVSFRLGSHRRYGVLGAQGVVDLTDRFAPECPDLKSLIGRADWRQRVESAVASANALLDYETLQLESVIPNPEKILCVALNYHDHVAEANRTLPGGREVPKYPMVFVRFPDTLIGHRASLVVPRVSSRLDYEAELLVVMGQHTPRYVPVADALKYVFGYAAVNEGSIRDYQFHSRQLTPGKNFAGSGSSGPWLITADEVGDPQTLDIDFRLNGQVLQQANTSDMIFSVAQLISYITEWLPLKPGDLIASGTMGGVGFTREPPIFMKPGDTAEVRIGGVGTLVNSVRNERAQDIEPGTGEV